MASMPLTIQITLTDEQLWQLAEAVADKMENRLKGPFKVREFADLVGESETTIRRKLAAGIINKIDRAGETRISSSELERYRSGKPSSP